MTPEVAELASQHLGAIKLYQAGIADIDARIAEVEQEKLSGERAALSLNNGRTVAMDTTLSSDETIAILNYFKDMIVAKKLVHDKALEAL